MFVYTIRIIYKSGATMDFEVVSFKVENGRYTWQTYYTGNNTIKPIQLGAEDVAAVWQIGAREVQDPERGAQV